MKFWILVVHFSIIIFGIIWCKEGKILIFQVLIVLFPEKSAIFQVFQVYLPKSAVFQVFPGFPGICGNPVDAAHMLIMSGGYPTV